MDKCNHGCIKDACAMCRVIAQRDQLRNALSQAVVWDAYDDEGVEAVWLEDARAALKATEEE